MFRLDICIVLGSIWVVLRPILGAKIDPNFCPPFYCGRSGFRSYDWLVSRWPPRPSQEGPRAPPKRPKTPPRPAQEGPRPPKSGPRPSQDRPKRAQEPPRAAKEISNLLFGGLLGIRFVVRFVDSIQVIDSI